MRILVPQLRKKLTILWFAVFFNTVFNFLQFAAASSLADTNRCEFVFNSYSSAFVNRLTAIQFQQIPEIMRALEAEQITNALNPKGCAEFMNACALATVLVGVEALERKERTHPTPLPIFKSEGQILAQLLKAVTQRPDPSLTFDETMGLLRFQLSRRGLLKAVTLRTEKIAEVADLALAPNEMMLVGAEAPGYGHHMILLFQYNEKNRTVNAVDPMTGAIENYGIAMTPLNQVRLVSFTHGVRISAVLDLVMGIRMSPEPARMGPKGTSTPAREKIQKISEKVKLLRSIVEDLYPLLPASPRSRFPDLASARSFIAELLKNLELAEEALSIDLASLAPEDAAILFALNLQTSELRKTTSENAFFDWLLHHQLIDPPKGSRSQTEMALPQWTLPMLEARVSTHFKTDREKAFERIRNLAQKSELSKDDINFKLGRIIQDYADLLIAVASEVQVKDAHRLLTNYFIEADKLLRSTKVQSTRHENNLFFEIYWQQWEQIQEVRKTKFGL